MNYSDETKGTRCHLSADDRYEIQNMLNNRQFIRSIAKHLGRNPSTILREIRNHLTILPEKGTNCINKKECNHHQVCGSITCKKACKNCTFCKKHCEDYVEAFCDMLQKSPYLCNGCPKLNMCNYKHRIYKAVHAEREYRSIYGDFFDMLGLYEIPPREVLLKPSLLSQQIIFLPAKTP